MPNVESQGRIPIDRFKYDPATQTFRYLITGEVWKVKGVDGAVGPVLHEGRVLKATEWLKRYGAGR